MLRRVYRSHHHRFFHLHSLARRCSSSATIMPPSTDVDAFHEVLRSSRRILALCGAGLSASSGLPTFRGAGGLWRNHDATTLATPTAFGRDPGLVWMFYGYRRHMALNVKPNPAHYALAALAEKNKDFLCLTQNVDSECLYSPWRRRSLDTLFKTSPREQITLRSSSALCTAPSSTSSAPAPSATGSSTATTTTPSSRPSRRPRRTRSPGSPPRC